jgi:hypothetical protein
MKTSIDEKELTKLHDERISLTKLEIEEFINVKFSEKKNLAQDEEHQGDTSIGVLSDSKTNNTSDDEEHTLYNTESFHLQAVIAVTTDYSTSREYKQCLQKWIMPVASVWIVTIQLIVLLWLIYEASHPTCSMHDDCNIGEYCDNTGGSVSNTYTTPRCDSCMTMRWSKSKPTSSCESYEDTNEDVLVWISKDGNYHPSDLNNSTAIGCLEYLHCDGTDTGTNNCDYLDLNLDKITWPNKIVFFFVAILFSGSLYQDIKESMVEEELLNHALAKTAGTHQSRAQKNSTQLLAWIVRLTLRLRIFVLPWAIAAASTTIIVVESLSAKNILLNLLAIGFIAEADNVFGQIFLSDSQKSRADDFVDQSKKEVDKDDVNISPLWLRSFAILPTVIMVVAVLNMKEFLIMFSYDARECSVSGAVLRGICIACPLIMVMIAGVKHFFQDKNYSGSKRFISASYQICLNSIVVYLSFLIYFIAYLAIAGSSADDLKVYGIVFGIGLLFNVIISYVLSCTMENDQCIFIGALLSCCYVTPFIILALLVLFAFISVFGE